MSTEAPFDWPFARMYPVLCRFPDLLAARQATFAVFFSTPGFHPLETPGVVLAHLADYLYWRENYFKKAKACILAVHEELAAARSRPCRINRRVCKASAAGAILSLNDELDDFINPMVKQLVQVIWDIKEGINAPPDFQFDVEAVLTEVVDDESILPVGKEGDAIYHDLLVSALKGSEVFREAVECIDWAKQLKPLPGIFKGYDYYLLEAELEFEFSGAAIARLRYGWGGGLVRGTETSNVEEPVRPVGPTKRG